MELELMYLKYHAKTVIYPQASLQLSLITTPICLPYMWSPEATRWCPRGQKPPDPPTLSKLPHTIISTL